MLFASDISKSYSERTLFSGLTLTIASGDRIALIGANGSGKTTLLEILAGSVDPDIGGVTMRRNLSVGYLKQEPDSFSDVSLLQEVLNADVKANVVEEEIAVAQGELSSETDPER